MEPKRSKPIQFNPQYPSVDILRAKAKKRMPKFAFEYLDGGCNENINIKRNTTDIRKIQLIPEYLKNYKGADTSTQLFGKTYAAPFGISPVGLQGLMWPNATEILAKAAFEHNIPFILSTVTTASIEKVAEITQGQAWFQLYHPAKTEIRDDMLNRLEDVGIDTLVLLCDVPTFGFRPNDIKNGLAMPPKMSLRNFIQISGKLRWTIQTLKHGTPKFKTMSKYMDKKMGIESLGRFMDETFEGRLPLQKIKAIRDKWKGKLVLKGVASISDAQKSVQVGLDGIIVSNHGGRQLDAGESSISAMQKIIPEYGDKIQVMIDSGLRSGPDVARCIAAGAKFTFMGRSFMYGVGALGKKGGDHTISMIKRQFQQNMEQICCEYVADLPKSIVG